MRSATPLHKITDRKAAETAARISSMLVSLIVFSEMTVTTAAEVNLPSIMTLASDCMLTATLDRAGCPPICRALLALAVIDFSRVVRAIGDRPIDVTAQNFWCALLHASQRTQSDYMRASVPTLRRKRTCKGNDATDRSMPDACRYYVGLRACVPPHELARTDVYNERRR